MNVTKRLRLWHWSRVMARNGTFVIQDTKTGLYQGSCHTTGATYFDFSLDEAETYGYVTALIELRQDLDTRDVKPLRVVSSKDRHFLPLRLYER